MYSLSYILLRVTFCVVITLTRVKAQQLFLRSRCMVLREENLAKSWLNPGLNLIIFLGTWPRCIDFQISLAMGLYYKEDEIHKIAVIFKQMLKLRVKQ